MKTFVIKKEHLDKDNYYIGIEDLSNFDGNIESEENLGYVKFKTNLSAKGYIFFRSGSGIKAGRGISAGWGIEAGRGIEAGSGISAGCGISAGWGISAGLGISCKLELSCKYRIFAGLWVWGNLSSDDEKTITCGKLVSGTVEYGILKEIGLPTKDNDKKTALLLKADELIKKANELKSEAEKL